jgi:hypothetical protein
MPTYRIHGADHDRTTKSARKAATEYFQASQNDPGVNLYIGQASQANIVGQSGRIFGTDRALLDAWHDIPEVREQRRRELADRLTEARQWTRYEAIEQVRADHEVLNSELITPAERRQHEVDMELMAEVNHDYRGELDTLRAKAALTEMREPDSPEEINKIECIHEIDPDETLVRAAAKRERDRAELAAEMAAQEKKWLGLRAEDKRIGIENLSEEAQERHESNLLAERTGGVTEYTGQVATEREKARQSELLSQINQQFRVAGAKFYFKDRQDTVAFKDKGERMVTASNEDRVAKAMATMAEAKGWKTITISGHPEFKRQVWLEANARGIEVRGYKPNERDLQALEAYHERQMRNTVAREPGQQATMDAPKRAGDAGAVDRQVDQKKIVAAVASELIAEMVGNPVHRAALQRSVEARLRGLAQSGKVPNVPIYDKSAPPRKPQERARAQVEHTAERTR